MVEIDRIYNMDCINGFKLLDDNSIDLVVTSPPYDDLRTYNGYSFDFESVAKELYRVLKSTGVVVWIVNDATIDGSETLTSFKQALYFKEIGFKVNDTMIWEKPGFTAVGALKYRYAQVFEYMFVLTKGSNYTFNPIRDKKIFTEIIVSMVHIQLKMVQELKIVQMVKFLMNMVFVIMCGEIILLVQM